MHCIAKSSVTLILVIHALWAGVAGGAEPCLVALDLGSSGIRAGTADSARMERVPFNALGLLGKETGVSSLEEPTVQVLNTLFSKSAFDKSCDRLGGGFSVWRLALERDRHALVPVLERIQAQTGVAVIVIPPQREGQYAYIAARHSLGEQLTTTHVLDIGGGSMQVSSATGAWGLPLGQKTWHQLLCRELGRGESGCALEPLSATELDQARRLASAQTRPLTAAMPPGISLSAVSRPVTRGIKPYLDAMSLPASSAKDGTRPGPAISNLTIGQLGVAIDSAAIQPPRKGQTAEDFSRYLLSDMLLVEGIMAGTGLETLAVADMDLSNVPGLLEDARAYAWLRLYGCYLGHLRDHGIKAFDRNPGECVPGSH